MAEVGGRDANPDRCAPGVVRRRRSGSTQSPNWKSSVHSRSSPASSGRAVDPGPHRVELSLQHANVAVPLVERRRHDGGRVSPAPRRAAAAVEHVGDHAGHGAVGPLFRGEVAQARTPRKPARVVEERGGRREHLDVAGPAEPLVALRAVGRQPRKLPRIPHTMLSCSWFTRSSEHSNQPVRPCRCARRGRQVVGVSSPGQPVTSANRNPWNVNRGCQVSSAVAAQRVRSVAVGVAGAARAQLTVFEHFGVADGDLVPAGPRRRAATTPTRFWPKSTIVRPLGDSRISDGRGVR